MAVMSDSVVLTGLSPNTPREIIVNHLKTVTNGGNNIQYLLYPFINDFTTAVVKFRTAQGVHDVVVHPNIINGTKVKVKMLPPQVYSRCHAVIDSFIVACLPNLKKNSEPLKELGVELEANIKTGEVRMTGSLLQLQCAQHVIHQMMLNQGENQERRLVFHNSGLGSSQDGLLSSTARSSIESARSSVNMDILQSITARSLDLGPNLTSAQFQRLTQSGPSIMNTAVPDWQPYAPLISTRGSTLRNSQASTISDTLRQSSASTKSTLISSNNSMNLSASLAEVDPDKLEVDSLVFDYIVLKHSDQVLGVEEKYNVKMKYKRTGMKTTIMVAPQSMETSHDIQGGKDELINLYKIIFFSVKKEVIAIDPDSMRKDLFKKVMHQIKQDYSQDLIVAEPTDYTIILLGKNFYVMAATQYIKKMLGGKIKQLRDERQVQTAREDKPKMVYMMHSAPVSPVPSSSPPATTKSALSSLRSTGRTNSVEEMSGLIVTGKPATTPRSSLSKSGSLRSSSGSLKGSMRRSGSWDKGKVKVKGGHGKPKRGTEVFYDSLDPRRAAEVGRSSAVVSQDMLRSVLLGKQMNKHSAVSFEFDTPGGVKVSVETGNLTEEEMDVIVNPAREDLHLLTGISETISEAAGPNMQRECTQYVVKHGNMKVSDVMHTEATGQLKCYFLVHAVGPMWCLYTDKEKCKDALTETYLNSLIYSQNVLKAKSVAFSAVGTGMFGIPLGICCQAAYVAIQQFDAMNDWSPFLQEIKFVHQDDKMTSVMTLIFQGLLQEPANPSPSLTELFDPNVSLQGQGEGHESIRASLDDEQLESVRSTNFLQEFGSLVSSARSDNSKIEPKKISEVGFDTLVSKQVAKWAVPTSSLIESEDFSEVPHAPFRQNEDTWNDFIGGTLEENKNGGTNTATEDFLGHLDSTDKNLRERLGDTSRSLQNDTPEITPVLPMSSIDDSPPSSERSDIFTSPRSDKVKSSRSEKGLKTRSRSKRTKRTTSEGAHSAKSNKNDKTGSRRIAASLWSSNDLEDDSYHGHDLADSTHRNDTSRSFRSIHQNSQKEDTRVSIESGTLTRLFQGNSSARTQDSADWSDVPARLATPDVPASPASILEHQTRSQMEEFDSEGETKEHDEDDEIEGDQGQNVIMEQPSNGRMLFEVNRKIRLAGYPDIGTIVINYDFPSGKIQGISYDSASFQAYLPYNQEGRTVLTGFRKAFEDLRTFVVHRDGHRGRLEWADVEHKTSLEEDSEEGYPDEDYLLRVKNWLIEEGYG